MLNKIIALIPRKKPTGKFNSIDTAYFNGYNTCRHQTITALGTELPKIIKEWVESVAIYQKVTLSSGKKKKLVAVDDLLNSLTNTKQ